MVLGLAVAALVVAILALSVAMGVSLGRNGDRQDDQIWRAQVEEAFGQVYERLPKKVKDDE
jgi:hypothetical protein